MYVTVFYVPSAICLPYSLKVIFVNGFKLLYKNSKVRNFWFNFVGKITKSISLQKF